MLLLSVVCNEKRKPVFRGTQVAPAKAKRDRQTDNGQNDPCVVLCFAGATKMSVNIFFRIGRKYTSVVFLGLTGVSLIASVSLFAVSINGKYKREKNTMWLYDYGHSLYQKVNISYRMHFELKESFGLMLCDVH